MRLTCVIILALALGGCLSTTIKVDGCTIFAPIHGSKKDTPGSISQIDAHNAKGIGACNWQP